MADKNTPDFLDDLDLNLEPIADNDMDLDALLKDLNLSLSNEEKSRLDPLDDFSLDLKTPQSTPSSQGKFVPRKPVPPAPEPKEHRKHTAPEKTSVHGTVSRHRGVINACLCLIALVLVVGIGAMVMFLGHGDPFQGKILHNVSIAGVDVGGMSANKALQTIKKSVGADISHKDMVVTLGNDEIVLSPAFTHVVFHAEDAVTAAFAAGRVGTNAQQEANEIRSNGMDISIVPYLEIDVDYLRSVLEEQIGVAGGEFVPSGYTLEGRMPSLNGESFDESAPCQALMLTVGHPGSDANIDAIVDAIMDAYSRDEFQVAVPLESFADLPEALDLDAIYAEVNIAPVEAEENPLTHEVIPGSCGYTFSLEEARQELAQANYGDVITIPMQYVKPAKLDAYGDFPVCLGSYSSPLSTNAGYNKNLELICQSINGTILEPNENFSFNSTCVPRTAANGFVSAPTHDIYCATEDLNAGADQVASTMYVCAINADLVVTERHSADHACGYTMIGTELTVLHNWEDLKFRNVRSEPVKIRATVTDTQVVIRIFGQTAPEYTTALEFEQLSHTPFKTSKVYLSADSGYKSQDVIFEGLEGGIVQLYRVKYDPNTKAEVSRARESYIEVRSASKLVAEIK